MNGKSDTEKRLFEKLSGKKAVLLGAGVSNTPLAVFLSRYGASVEVRDKKTREELGDNGDAFEKCGAALVLGDGYLDGIKGDLVFRSPGFRPDTEALEEARRNGATVTSETELFMELRPAFVIGVTGSDGKSTTTTLISKILEKAFEGTDRTAYLGGNIGYPLLDRVVGMKKEDAVAAELSSFQLMTVSRPVDVAVITNVTPNHLNWHTGMDEYVAAKANILKGAGRAVLNFGNEITRELGRGLDIPITYFSREPIASEELQKKDSAVFLEDGKIVFYEKADGSRRVVMDRSDILLPGLHNAENYMAAFAATVGIAKDRDVLEVARTFGGVKHRLELIRVVDGVRCYNSSIDSSPTRTAAALSAITDRPINIICGGYDKKIPFAPLAQALADCPNLKTVTLTGATAEKIRAAIKALPEEKRKKLRVFEQKDLRAAVLEAKSHCDSGDVLLLSPACASFDAFKNFEERGDFFRKIVSEM